MPYPGVALSFATSARYSGGFFAMEPTGSLRSSALAACFTAYGTDGSNMLIPATYDTSGPRGFEAVFALVEIGVCGFEGAFT